jgi:hypothetical protein
MRTRRHHLQRQPRTLTRLLGLALFVGFGTLAWVRCGGSNPAAPPPTIPAPTTTTLPPAPATLADLSASVTSPQADGSLNCVDDVRARVTLTNRSGTDVAVTGILDASGVPAGNCFGGRDYTFKALTPIVPGHSTTVVLDQSLYSRGPGCCQGKGCGGSCVIQESFQVLTSVGNVPAGAFNYKVFFQNCPPCGSVSATGAPACKPPSRLR